jgi:hypothetical protein
MREWYQRRTQKGMGRTEKTVHTGAAKNPRLLKACNITLEKGDMCEFFFISNVDEIVPKLFYNTKKDNFLRQRNILTYYFSVVGLQGLPKKGNLESYCNRVNCFTHLFDKCRIFFNGVANYNQVCPCFTVQVGLFGVSDATTHN